MLAMAWSMCQNGFRFPIKYVFFQLTLGISELRNRICSSRACSAFKAGASTFSWFPRFDHDMLLRFQVMLSRSSAEFSRTCSFSMKISSTHSQLFVKNISFRIISWWLCFCRRFRPIKWTHQRVPGTERLLAKGPRPAWVENKERLSICKNSCIYSECRTFSIVAC